MMIEELETALAEEAEGKATAEAALAESETKLKQAVRSLETIWLLSLFAKDERSPVPYSAFCR
eukprot:COSAG05_NODE_18259_length_311_cov_0.726415_1_plen_62_part_10